MEDEEDPVVQEIPVYLSQALAKNLYIYQLPATPANRNWHDVKIVNASIKPMNQLVRLDIGLDTESEKFCESKGEQIALNTDGYQETRYSKDKDKEKEPYFKHGIMDKIAYESSTPCVKSDHYAVAILQDKELHCTPVKGIVQLRPSYSYFDKQDKRRKDSKKDNSDDEDEEPEAQQVTVKFARQETDLIKKARERSFEFISKKTAEEPWYEAQWKHADTDHSDLERLKLFAGEMTPASLSMRPSHYVRMLVPAPPEDEADVVRAESKSVSEQIKDILKSAKLMTFSDLRSLIRPADGAQISESSFLSTLCTSAVCVRGLWASRSEDLYEKAHPPPQLMCRAREHVLYLFTQHPYVDRRKVAAVVRLPPSEVLEIIQSVAKLNPRTGWELILPPDTAFEAKHPDTVQRHLLYLEGRQRLFNEIMLSENIPKRHRKKSLRDSFSSDTMLSPKARCNSVSEEDSDSRKRQKNKSTSGQGKRTRNVSTGSANEGS